MIVRSVLLLSCSALLLHAQKYDLVLRGGHVLDPTNGIDAVRDVAISGSKIAAVEARIAPEDARKSIDVSGSYVVPGLVDIHFHIYGSAESISADDTALPTGATTIVDAGGTGWRTFDGLRAVAAKSKTRVLALLNIVGEGMKGEPFESNTEDMDPVKTAGTIERNRDILVGIKTAHYAKPGWTAIDRAVEAGRRAGVPVMADDKIFTNSGRTTREELLDHLRPGDIHTHMYNDRQMELVDRFNSKVQPYMLEARRRGVRFDLGHGAGSFLWPVASRAMAQGFVPDSISTDLHKGSVLGPQSDMPNAMSKMMLLGMSLQDVVARSTVNPAKTIGRYPELGTLGVSRTADIAVLELRKGAFALIDAWGAKRLAPRKLECVLTVRNGEVVYGPVSVARESAASEIYDLLLKNGHVVDPVNHRDGSFDVAVIGKKIARVGRDLHASHARLVVEASQYYVTPGWIARRAQPDYLALRNGITRTGVAGAAEESRLVNLGQTIAQVIERGTKGGTLSEGGAADIAVFEVEKPGAGDPRMRCVMTVRNGAVVWDSEGLTAPDWIKAGPYSNFR